eukprot:5957991-Karenia_brevis.AAC.1
MHVGHEAQGVQMWANLLGKSTSSTRVELLGFCLAMLANKPVNAAIDNSAVVEKGMKLIRQLRTTRDYIPNTPYNMQVDGDLWAIAHSAIKTRGPHSVSITKVKGHAEMSECHTQALRERKHHNDKADKIAADAHAKIRSPCVLDLSC